MKGVWMTEPSQFSQYLSIGAIDMKFSPDVGNHPFSPHVQRNQTIDAHNLSYVQ